MIQLVQYIKEHKELNAIIFVLDYQQIRFSYNMKIMLKLFCNIFPIKEIIDNIALVFTKSFTSKGRLTAEQKQSKLEKCIPELKKKIGEESGLKISKSIVSGFVDIDPELGIDENGKMDLNRIIAWASFLPNLNVSKFIIPEPYIKFESRDFIETKFEGDYILKEIITKKREIYLPLDGSITYGDWKEKERKEEKILNPEIEKIKTITLNNQQRIKIIQEENDNKIKLFKEENIKIKEKLHKEFLEMIASNKKKEEEEIEKMRMLQIEKERIIKEQKEEEDEKKMSFEKRISEIINAVKILPEAQQGECSKGQTLFSAGITEENVLVKEVNLSEVDSVFKTEFLFGTPYGHLKKNLKGKIIVGWKLESNNMNERGGYWERNTKVLRTSSYSFNFRTGFGRRCNWKLRIWAIDDIGPKE